MATITAPSPRTDVKTGRSDLANPAFQGFALLRLGFTVAPILFGLDKFLNWLVDWRIYLAPEINNLIPGNAHQAMLVIGVIEIIAGLVVLVRPKFGGYLVAAWLGGVIPNPLLPAQVYDIAPPGFGVLLAPPTRARRATAFERSPAPATV